MSSVAAPAPAELVQRTVDGPTGPVGLAVGPDGLVHVDLWADPSQPSEGRSAEADAVARQFEQYFRGRRRAFDVRLDWSELGGFRLQVLRTLAEVPYGTTLSYGELAERAGSPRAYRAVGSTMASNPLGIVVPCHRVVAAGGRIGGFGGGIHGIELKRALLALEGVELD
jgi:methylated-DNA-[protein]-cysteine S-methyltransferase